MHTLSICPTCEQELDLHHLSSETHLFLTTVQPMPRHQRHPFAHGRQETRLQLDLGQRRQVITSQPQPMLSSLILSGPLIKKPRTSTA
jgi:hypothetical protein